MGESEDQFRLLAETLPQLVWTTGPDGRHDYFNRRWYEFTGLPATDRTTGSLGWNRVLHPEDHERTRAAWQASLDTGKPYEMEYRIRGADGRHRWFLARALPIRDEAGRILRWFGTCTDIDDRKSAEQALRRLEEQRRLALEAADLGTWDIGLASGVVTWDARCRQLLGLAGGEATRSMTLEDVFRLIHPEDRERVRAVLSAASAPFSDGRCEAEYRAVHGDGTVRWLHMRGQALLLGEGARRRAVRLSGVLGDVTDRRTADEARQLLARELNHRIKNLFAIASSMIALTARSAETPKQMAEALRGRIGALARAHELIQPALTTAGEAEEGTTLEQLVDAILAPHLGLEATGLEGSQIARGGPPVTVGPKAVTGVALILHELATNALKYGALSTAEGRLDLQWGIEDGSVRLTWSEQGGPTLHDAPRNEGFGTQLARKTAVGQLGGSIVPQWRPTGLVVALSLPLDRLAR